MSLRKYDFQKGSGFMCVRIKVMTNCSVGSPEYYLLDEMSPDELEAMIQEHSDEEEAMCGDAFRGLSWAVVDVSELPEGFFEEHLSSAISNLEHTKTKIAWYESVVASQSKKQKA